MLYPAHTPFSFAWAVNTSPSAAFTSFFLTFLLFFFRLFSPLTLTTSLLLFIFSFLPFSSLLRCFFLRSYHHCSFFLPHPLTLSPSHLLTFSPSLLFSPSLSFISLPYLEPLLLLILRPSTETLQPLFTSHSSLHCIAFFFFFIPSCFLIHHVFLFYFVFLLCIPSLHIFCSL